MDDLLARVRQYAQRYRLFNPGETLVVGVSGGPDSLCLLHLLRRLAPELRLWLHVAHLHHGLRGAEADADAAFVAELADCWGLPCTVGRADVAALAREAGLSLEEAARQARYRFLAEVAEAGGATTLAVGHNADDQAETVLMHFLRGSGAAGLRGMLPKTPSDDYRLLQAVSDAGHDAAKRRSFTAEGAEDAELFISSSALSAFSAVISGTDGGIVDPPPSSDPHVTREHPHLSTSSVLSCRSRAPRSRPIAPTIASRRAPTAATRTRLSSATGCDTSCCRSWKPTTRASVMFWRTRPRCWRATTRC